MVSPSSLWTHFLDKTRQDCYDVDDDDDDGSRHSGDKMSLMIRICIYDGMSSIHKTIYFYKSLTHLDKVG